MISYEEACQKAKELLPDADGCTEYENTYIFSSSRGRHCKGGPYAPVVVLKEDRRRTDMLALITDGVGTGKKLRSFRIRKPFCRTALIRMTDTFKAAARRMRRVLEYRKVFRKV